VFGDDAGDVVFDLGGEHEPLAATGEEVGEATVDGAFVGFGAGVGGEERVVGRVALLRLSRSEVQPILK